MTSTKRILGSTHVKTGVDSSKRDTLKSLGCVFLAASLGARAAHAAGQSADKTAQQVWGNPATLVSGIAAGTLTVPSLDETVSAYTRGFAYVEYWRGSVSPELAKFWGTPAMAGRRTAVLGPPEHDSGLIRVLELGDDFEKVNPYDSLGWVALEIRVRTPDDMVEQLKGLPFTHTGGPGDSSTAGGAPAYRAAQFKGPSGEPLYFTQHTQLDGLLEMGANNVGPLFIQTLAARPYLKSRDFYQETLGLQSRMEIDVPRNSLAKSLGLPQGRRYKMAAVRAPEFCSIQIDEYPKEAMPRPTVEGCLPPHSSMCTFATTDLDVVAAALSGSGIPFNRIEAHPMFPAKGSRAISCRGHSGEFVEFVERS
tara:strand:- start:16113 stop:17210 length:1098 start_codon:yes stop_codon:yes gene_type:complete